MSKEKNTFKKADANGNQLPEVKGKGLNLTHLLKVKEARRKDDYIRFRCSVDEKINFKTACNEIKEMTESEISRALHNAFANGKIKIK